MTPTGLKDYLVAKGARPGELVEAGLLIQPEDGGQPYDRFRDRIIFPITDSRGRVISFGGRALDADAKAKYLNGPESPLFHKGASLYLLPEARKRLHTPGEEDAPLVVVEGYMDAIACHRAGIAAVAPLGAALTEDQMAALWRLAAEPVLCFDGDAAGQRAAYRAIDRALPLLKPGRSFRFALPTGGKDPDEVLRQQGAKALRDQLAETKPLVEVLFQRERAAAEPLDTPERRSGFKVALRKLAGAVTDGDLAQAYRDDLLVRLEALCPAVKVSHTPAYAVRAWQGERRGAPPFPAAGASGEGKAAAHRLSQSLSPVAAALAAGALNHPDIVDAHLETLNIQGLGDQALATFARALVQIRHAAPSQSSEELKRELAGRGFQGTLQEIAWAAARSNAAFLRPDVSAEAAREAWARLFDVVVRVAILERTLEEVKAAAASDRGGFGEVYSLKAERDALRRRLGDGRL